jgi:hypothetical protein
MEKLIFCKNYLQVYTLTLSVIEQQENHELFMICTCFKHVVNDVLTQHAWLHACLASESIFHLLRYYKSSVALYHPLFNVCMISLLFVRLCASGICRDKL